ncbi:MAG: LuxR family transcriptional regulator [Bacteroidales bacterium]|nr:LuxR family transcriptional regulator [Bacteroidales bacterium]
MKILLLFIFCFSINSLIFAQEKVLNDSLLNFLNKKIEDTTRVNVLNKISWNYINTDFELALEYAQKSLDLAQSIDYNEGIALAYTHISYAQYRQSNFDDALISINKAIAVFEILNDKQKISKSLLTISQIYFAKSNYVQAINYSEQALEMKFEINDTNSLELNYLTLGVIYQHIGDYPKSLENHFKSIEFCEKNGNTKTLASNYNNIAVVYRLQEKYEKALEYYQKAVELHIETGNKIGESQSLNNIAVVYEALKSYDLALKYYNDALKIFNEIGYLQGKCTALTNIAGIEMSLEQLDDVESKLLEAEKIALQIEDPSKLISIYGLLGQYFLAKNQLPKAIKYTKTAYEMSQEIGSLAFMSNMAQQLSILFEKNFDYKLALEYNQSYNLYKDSLFNIQKTDLIEQMTMNFENEQNLKEIELKDTEILLLEKDNRISNNKITGLLIIISLIFALSTFVIFYFRKKIKAEKQIRLREIAIGESRNKIMELEISNKEIRSNALKNEIEYKNKEIQNFAFHIIDKNDFILNIQKQLKEAKKNLNNTEAQIEIQNLINLINSKMILERDREEFLAYIDQIHDNFHYNLNSKFPDLTDTETRIASLLRMGFSSKDISSILHITPKSVDTNRYRIRKKLNIDTDTNLNDFFKEI